MSNLSSIGKMSLFFKKNSFYRNLYTLIQVNTRSLSSLGIIAILSLLVLFCDLATPLLIRDIILSISSLPGTFFSSSYLAIGFLIGNHCLRALIMAHKSISTNRFQTHILGQLREKIAQQLVRSSTNQIACEAGSWMSSLSSDLFCLESFLSSTLWETLIQTLFFCISGFILFQTHPNLAIWAFTPIPIAVFLNSYFLPKFRNSIRDHHETLKLIGARFQELIEGQPIIRTFQAQDSLLKRFKVDNQTVSKKSEVLGLWTGIYSPLYEWIGGCSLALLLLGGKWLLVRKQISLEALFSFLVFLGYFYRPVFSSGRLFESWQKTQSALDRLSFYFKEASQIHFLPSLPFAAPSSIEIKKMTFGYKEHVTPLFKDLSFKLEAGQVTGVIGHNGAGKSTLLKLFAGLIQPHSGEIIFGREGSISSRQIAYLPQEPFLFQTTLLENILLTCPEAGASDVYDMAKLLRIHESILACPQGYSTQAGIRGTEISGGQRQRLSILRFALRAKTAAYCFLDEPSSYIDFETEKALIEVLLSICKGKTTVVVTHRPSTLPLCDHLIFVDQGQVMTLERDRDKAFFSEPTRPLEESWLKSN